MKIYTKTGDEGETGLLGGKRVPKTHPCITVCGTLDELNSWVGVLRSHLAQTPEPYKQLELEKDLEQIQNDLFYVGASVAGYLSETKKDSPVKPERIGELEKAIDTLSELIPPLTSFVLPGGNRLASWMHLARNVCRRCEREVVSLLNLESSEKSLNTELVYLNRLGDWMFMVARAFNCLANFEETKWMPDES